MDSNILLLVAFAIVLWFIWPGTTQPKAESFREAKRQRTGKRATRPAGGSSVSFTAEIPGIMLNAKALKSIGLPVKIKGHFLSLLKAQKVCAKSPDCIGYVKTTWKDANPGGGPAEYYSLIRAEKPAETLAMATDMSKTNEIMRVGEMKSRTFQLYLKKAA